MHALVGRTIALLKLDADEFDMIAPHFGSQTLVQLCEYGWEKILEGYNNYPASFKRVIPFLLASLMYHFDRGHLQSIPHSNHLILPTHIHKFKFV